jgi:hypothetical protein
MKTTRAVEDIDEQALIHSIYERDNGHSFRDRNTIQTTLIEANVQTVQSENKRMGIKQRKISLEDFRKQFMHAPKIDDRKPVFISLSVRDSLDRIVRLFGERGLSVSGLMENLARNFLETYKDDIEQWRKM